MALPAALRVSLANDSRGRQRQLRSLVPQARPVPQPRGAAGQEQDRASMAGGRSPIQGPGPEQPSKDSGGQRGGVTVCRGTTSCAARKLHAREKPAAGAQHLVRFPSFSSGFICMGLASVAAGRAVQAGRCPEERAVRRQGLPMTRAPRKSSSSCLLGAEDPPHTAPRRLRLYPPRAPLSRASAPSTDVPGRPDRPSSVPAERAGAFSRWCPFL